MGIAPLSITTRVCSDVPDATLVKAHAASNCNYNSVRPNIHLSPLKINLTETENIKIKQKQQGAPTCN